MYIYIYVVVYGRDRRNVPGPTSEAVPLKIQHITLHRPTFLCPAGFKLRLVEIRQHNAASYSYLCVYVCKYVCMYLYGVENPRNRSEDNNKSGCVRGAFINCFRVEWNRWEMIAGSICTPIEYFVTVRRCDALIRNLLFVNASWINWFGERNSKLCMCGGWWWCCF